MRRKVITRYIVTDVVSIPVYRMMSKYEAYREATKDGWGVVNWYSATNNYRLPVNRDKSDKTQQLFCDEDTSAILYTKYGQEFYLSPNDEVIIKDIPSQSEVNTIIISGSYGFSFWTSKDTNIKIYVTYDENGLIDTYRIDTWNSRPYEDETEISFDDLQSYEEHEAISRADIFGTLEHAKKNLWR